MSEIHLFKISRAEMEPEYDDGIRVRLFYPKNAETVTERLPANPEYGAEVLTEYKEKKRARIAFDKMTETV